MILGIFIKRGEADIVRNYREVTIEDAEKRSKELNVIFIETSAKAGHNVMLKRMYAYIY